MSALQAVFRPTAGLVQPAPPIRRGTRINGACFQPARRGVAAGRVTGVQVGEQASAAPSGSPQSTFKMRQPGDLNSPQDRCLWTIGALSWSVAVLGACRAAGARAARQRHCHQSKPRKVVCSRQQRRQFKINK